MAGGMGLLGRCQLRAADVGVPPASRSQVLPAGVWVGPDSCPGQTSPFKEVLLVSSALFDSGSCRLLFK